MPTLLRRASLRMVHVDVVRVIKLVRFIWMEKIDPELYRDIDGFLEHFATVETVVAKLRFETFVASAKRVFTKTTGLLSKVSCF